MKIWTLPTHTVLFWCTLTFSGFGVSVSASELNVEERWQAIESQWEDRFEGHFGVELTDRSIDRDDVVEAFDRQLEETGRTSAVVYVIPNDDNLELMLMTATEEPMRWVFPDIDRETLISQVRRLEVELTNPRRRRSDNYLEIGRELYDWIIAPLASELERQQIDTLIFCLGDGLRSMPLEVLYDGNQFLIETYSISRIPGFNLFDTQPADLRNGRVLAMGASEFENLSPLPAIPVELASIVPRLWPGATFLNENFTVENLQRQRQQGDYNIVHLATHARFVSGDPSRSYIQFWRDSLSLSEMRALQWNDPPVELLVLSGCETAQGDEEAEMGFAGLAVYAGVPSVVASLWTVSDTGAMLMMSEFYAQLKTAPTKAEALRRTQLAALRGQLRFENPEVSGLHPPGTLVFSELPNAENLDLSHPYQWAAFTIVGSPW
ncbi:MAG: CHAT domain-containing protein [Cyanobacteria bacterium SID2]|nr:CHAT domain-containing protein [Cyanobacteria bacterium SID2]MBP0004744.1 CHAT domain-containing protein [Cyanobacteria bacterium SBC]